MVGTQRTVEQALLATHRGGTCVIVGVCPAGTRLSIDPMLFLQQRVLTGTSFGGGHQRTDVPMLIDLYMSGKYKLDEMITRRVPLSDLNEAFDLMVQGEVKRSVVVYLDENPAARRPSRLVSSPPSRHGLPSCAAARRPTPLGVTEAARLIRDGKVTSVASPSLPSSRGANADLNAYIRRSRRGLAPGGGPAELAPAGEGGSRRAARREATPSVLLPNTAGTPALRAFVPKTNAPVVQ